MELACRVVGPLVVVDEPERFIEGSHDVIDFLRTRRERQDDARKQISSALADYNVVAVDTLIGDITPPEALMTTLTDRKLAEQEKVTYDTQRLAEETRKELQQATAMAGRQCRSSGMTGSGGTVPSLMTVPSSSGASATKSR